VGEVGGFESAERMGPHRVSSRESGIRSLLQQCQASSKALGMNPRARISSDQPLTGWSCVCVVL